MSGGTIISGTNVGHSELSQNVFIDDGSMIENSVIFDNVKIGKNVKLNKCIVDKHVTIPSGETIDYDQAEDGKRFLVTESGIVVIPQDYVFST